MVLILVIRSWVVWYHGTARWQNCAVVQQRKKQLDQEFWLPVSFFFPEFFWLFFNRCSSGIGFFFRSLFFRQPWPWTQNKMKMTARLLGEPLLKKKAGALLKDFWLSYFWSKQPQKLAKSSRLTQSFKTIALNRTYWRGAGANISSINEPKQV